MKRTDSSNQPATGEPEARVQAPVDGPPADVPAGTSEVYTPRPASERRAWLVAGVLVLGGIAVLVAVLSGVIGSSSGSRTASEPPPVLVAATTPSTTSGPVSASPAGVAGTGGKGGSSARRGHAARGSARGSDGHARAIVDTPSSAEQRADAVRFEGATETHIPVSWMAGFYPIYSEAQSTFGVNWLLIASIHRQESAFSTDPTTYHGLNFAGCCGGPMQFNVKNGPTTTWDLVADSYIYGTRPAAYDHETATHPSIYDDFDSIMAAAHLLSADGAGYALDGSAWDAAYDYYGHDATGVTYADQVLARAIGWSQHGFCINCGLETAMVSAVDAAYGAPVLAALTQASAARAGP